MGRALIQPYSPTTISLEEALRRAKDVGICQNVRRTTREVYERLSSRRRAISLPEIQISEDAEELYLKGDLNGEYTLVIQDKGFYVCRGVGRMPRAKGRYFSSAHDVIGALRYTVTTPEGNIGLKPEATKTYLQVIVHK